MIFRFKKSNTDYFWDPNVIAERTDHFVRIDICIKI